MSMKEEPTMKTTNAIVKSFLDYQTAILGHSQNTADGYDADLEVLAAVLAGNRNTAPENLTAAGFGSATLEELYAYMAAGKTGSLSPAARCRRASSARSFYRWMVKRGMIQTDPSAALETPKKQKSLPHYLTEDQCYDLLRKCGDGKTGIRDRAILTLFLSCGLRVSELCALNLRDLGEDYVRVIGKGNKERVVYFAGTCRKALDKWLNVREAPEGEDADALFVSNYRARISVRSVQAMVDRRLEDAGLDSSLYSPHKLRHTAATLMLKSGVDTRVLQEVLGHASLNTTQIYTHVDSLALRSAALANPIGA